MEASSSASATVNQPHQAIELQVCDAHTHLGATLLKMEKHVDIKTMSWLITEPDVDKIHHALNEKRQKPNQDLGVPTAEYTYRLNKIINVNCWHQESSPSKSYESAVEVQSQLENVFGTYGLHPHYASHWNDKIKARINAALQHSKSVAVGECGLDYFRNQSTHEQQIHAFREQIGIALEHNKPIVIHSRDAEPDCFHILKEMLPSTWPIHLHCFTGNRDAAFMYLDYFPNLCIGFTGCITFKSAEDLRMIIQDIPLDRLVLETDAPYMAPIPFRGKAAHSNMIPLVAKTIAQVKQLPLEQVCAQTTRNCIRLYRLP